MYYKRVKGTEPHDSHHRHSRGPAASQASWKTPVKKLMEYSEFLRSKNKVSGVLDEFQATQVICDSMSGDMTFEDLDAMDEPDIFYMCLDELRALSNN